MWRSTHLLLNCDFSLLQFSIAEMLGRSIKSLMFNTPINNKSRIVSLL
ncbi:hypothetical protein IFM89_000975 [Coptis chinensis]|uniref:Uncharacterized protein n=1 Tax=Coptis chinensis TaxID=261450 RepID=A0A835M420_9MAGN|nr:hypothetical protein IFM89_000975 [Coptis chinensis]